MMSDTAELSQPRDWLGSWPNLTNPGFGQSDKAELHKPMDWLVVWPDLT
jgi:hypothetical protein